MTNRELLQSQWRVVAEALHIELIAPFHVQLPDGSEHEFAVLLPQFGAPRGMLIDPDHSRATTEAIGAVGFAFSSVEPETHPLHLPVKAANYIECLVDWQWTSKEQFPDWYASAV
jgi:hypothetical protein